MAEVFVGREFSEALLAQLSADDAEQVPELLESALSAGVLQEAEQRLKQREQMVGLEELSKSWQSVRGQLTAEEQREIVWALVGDVTISPFDEVTVTGTPTSLEGWPKEALAAEQGFEP